MNKVILMGRLTRDPEIKYPQGSNPMAIARYSLAVDRKYKKDGEPTADFINCVSFGKSAEFVSKYVKQGTKLVVEGRIQTGSYTNKDGQKVYTTDIMVESQEFAESKGNGKPNETPNTNPSNASKDNGSMNVPTGIDSELPFN